MVGIVKRLRPRVVAPVFVGSNPTTHPIFMFIGVSPSGKATDSDSVIRRFESCYPSQYFAGRHSPAPWRHSQVVRQRSAKPLSPVQIRVSPPRKKTCSKEQVFFYFFAIRSQQFANQFHFVATIKLLLISPLLYNGIVVLCIIV